MIKLNKWTNIYNARLDPKKVGVLTSQSLLQVKTYYQCKGNYLMMINGPVNQKDTAVLNVYALNIRASTYMR